MATKPSVPRQRHTLGGMSSAVQLDKLGFNPIEELVLNYRRLQTELDNQEKMRTGELVILQPNGKARPYIAEVHMNLYDKLTNIAEKLLRYRYGRVPELNNEEKQKAAGTLVVNLTKQGDVYTINEQPDLPMREVMESDLPGELEPAMPGED